MEIKNPGNWWMIKISRSISNRRLFTVYRSKVNVGFVYGIFVRARCSASNRSEIRVAEMPLVIRVGNRFATYYSSLPRRRVRRIIVEPRTAFVAAVRHFAERFPSATAQHDRHGNAGTMHAPAIIWTRTHATYTYIYIYPHLNCIRKSAAELNVSRALCSWTFCISIV